MPLASCSEIKDVWPETGSEEFAVTRFESVDELGEVLHLEGYLSLHQICSRMPLAVTFIKRSHGEHAGLDRVFRQAIALRNRHDLLIDFDALP